MRKLLQREFFLFSSSNQTMGTLTIFLSFMLLSQSLGAKISNSIPSTGDHRIVGGEAILIADAPYQVSLRNRGEHDCGGSIISSTFILTAAHCTEGAAPRQLTVRVGTNYSGKKKTGETFRVKRIISHPDYNNETVENDIALLQLSKPINMKANVQEAVKLPPMNDPVDDGTLVFASGWGETYDVNESEEYLRGVDLSILDLEMCEDSWGPLTDKQICTEDPTDSGKDSCQVSVTHSISLCFVTEFQFRVTVADLL